MSVVAAGELLLVAATKLENAMASEEGFTVVLGHLDDLRCIAESSASYSLFANVLMTIVSASHHSGRRDYVRELAPLLEQKVQRAEATLATVEVWALLARIHCVYGNAAGARRAADAASRLAKGRNSKALSILADAAQAVVELAFGRIDKAAACYSSVIRACADDEWQGYWERFVGDLGFALMESGDIQQAQDVLADAGNSMCTHRVLYVLANLALLLFSTDQSDELAKCCTRIADTNSVLGAEWARVVCESFRDWLSFTMDKLNVHCLGLCSFGIL